jgi:ribosomal-protein-serine acetyltransferase
MRSELTDGPVTIRRFRPEDAPALYEAVRESIAELSPRLPWCHERYALAESESWIAACRENWKTARAFAFAVFSADTGRLLGGVGIHQVDPLAGSGLLGYWVRTSATGNGVATAAAILAARFAFASVRLGTLEILVEEGNAASRRVAEKVGGLREASLQVRDLYGRGRREMVVYTLVPEDL